MKEKLIQNVPRTALFAALVWLFSLSGSFFPTGGGSYISVGDAVVYLSAMVLPLPYALLASAVGSVIADLTVGSAVYVIPTVIIKILTVLAVKWLLGRSEKPAMQDLLACLAGVVTVVGYCAADIAMLLFSGPATAAALAETAQNCVMFKLLQAGASAAVFLLVSGIYRSFINRKQENNDE